jgi:hypothetical protein
MLRRFVWLTSVNDVNLIFKLLTIARIEGFFQAIVGLQLKSRKCVRLR